MKIAGSHFNRNLEHNMITFKNKMVSIHSYDGAGMGIIRNEQNSLGKEDEEFKIYLSGTDSRILSKFKEVDIKLTEKAIVCKMGAAKFNIKRNDELKEIMPNLQNLKEINVDIELFKTSAQFVGKIKPGFEGIQIFNNFICSSDSIAIYKAAVNVTDDESFGIHVPVSILKLLKESDYTCKYNDTNICLFAPGELVYSNLYSSVNPGLKTLSKETPGKIVLNYGELVEHLTMISSFTNIVQFSLENDTLKITSASEQEVYKDYEAKIKAEHNLNAYIHAFDVSKLLNLIRYFDENNKITFYVTKGFIKLEKNNELSYLAGFKTPAGLIVEVK